MRDRAPLRYREWGPYWALAWLGGWLWATSGPDLSWRRVAAIVLACFGPLLARGVRYLLLGLGMPSFRYRYGYDCPAGHFTCSSNDQAAMERMRIEHQKTCRAWSKEASRV